MRSISYETKSSKSFIPKGECVYSAQSWKERRLLCESMFIEIDGRISILNMVEREVFLWAESINVIYRNEKNVFIVPNHEKKWDYYVNPCLT